MSELFGSIRADLTDRRLLPVVVLVAVCLVAAVAYALLGGSGGSPSPIVRGPAPSASAAGIAVTTTTPEHAVAETTDGYKEQSAGRSRDPFALLPGAASGASNEVSSPESASSAPIGTAASGSAGASPETSSGSTETTTPETKTEPKKHSTKPKTVYNVAIEFGTLPPGITPETAQLTPFTKLRLQTPLPSAQLPLLVFRGVTAKGKSATFTLVGEAILSGAGACLPSPTQCEAVDLKPGVTEQLSYLAPDGQATIYELRVLSITPEKAKAKASKASTWAESKAGRDLLRASGLVALPFLRYSSQPGVLVFAPRKASAAQAHTASIAIVG